MNPLTELEQVIEKQKARIDKVIKADENLPMPIQHVDTMMTTLAEMIKTADVVKGRGVI